MANAVAKPRVRVDQYGHNARLIPPSKSTSVGYMRGNASPFFYNWNPALRDHAEEVRASYTQAAARAIDAMQNSGWLAGAVDHSIGAMVGAGLRLAARPDRVSLGWTDGEADKWSELVERRWAMWSDSPIECDAAGKHTMPEMCENVIRAYYSHGESLALLPSIRRDVSLTRTKVMMLQPHRLTQDTDELSNLYQGVSTDGYGLPLAYKISKGRKTFETDAVNYAARDGAGRPQVAHIFEGREGQMRGLTPFAPVLRTVRQYDQLADATLTAALIQAIFAATVEGDAPTEEIMRSLQTEEEQTAEVGESGFPNWLGMQAAWYEGSKIDLGGAGRIAHLFPGQTLKFNRSEHPNSTYEAFAKFLLREVARCAGVTFESLSGDYSGATYSSVRMSVSELWPITLKRRNRIPARFMQVVYEAWLEEEIERRTIPFPGGFFGFLAMRPAAVLANWRGPAKPQADDLKTAKAHQIYDEMGVMSHERIADDLGYDIGDEYERRSREKKLRGELDLPEPTYVQQPAGGVDDETENKNEVENV